jgi:hypothetical protein
MPPGAPVVSTTCTPNAPTQEWYYYDGQIISLNGPFQLCLDATTMANMKQLVVNLCNGMPSQNWQIK